MSVVIKQRDNICNWLWLQAIATEFILLLLIMLILPVLLFSFTTGEGEGVIPVTNNLNHQLEPVIYDNYVIWTDYRNDNGSGTNSDIYLYDLSTHQERAICTDTRKQVRPDIYGTWLAWEDNRHGLDNWEIYGYDLTTGTEIRITNHKDNQNNPAIYENFIVWEDVRRAIQDPSRHDNDIYIHDIDTTEVYPLTVSDGEQIDADIYGDYVVWTDRRNGNADIYLYDLSMDSDSDGIPNYRDDDLNKFKVNPPADPAEQPLVTNPEKQHNPAIYDHLVVYQDYRNGNSDIYLYNLNNNTEIPLVTAPEEESLPRIYGNYVVYEKLVDNQREIYYYDLTTSTTGQITYQPSNQEFPDINGKTVVWLDFRNDKDGRVTQTAVDNGDIYMYKIPPVDITNHPPVISDITAIPASVEAGGQVTILVEGHDEDNDFLEFSFTYPAGTLVEIEDNKAIWEAPAEVGYYNLSAYASDGDSFSNTMTVMVHVFKNRQPVILNVSIQPAAVKCGRSTTITVHASDPDQDKLVYEFISSKGKITGQESELDNEVTWTAPENDGEFQIVIKVSDYSESMGETLSTTEKIITITVLPRASTTDNDSGFLPGFEFAAIEIIIVGLLAISFKILGLSIYNKNSR